MIGETVRKELFGAQNPVGSEIRIRNFACEVVGLLGAKGQSAMGSDQDDVVVMPLRTVQRRLSGNQDTFLAEGLFIICPDLWSACETMRGSS